MGIVIRQSILTSVISYAGVIIGYLNLIYLFPKFLTPEQVGLVRTVTDTALLFAPFAVFGLGQSIIRFYPRFAASPKDANRFISLILVLSTLTFSLFAIVFHLLEEPIMSFFRKNARELLQYTSLILVLTFFLVIITLLEQYSRSLLQVALPGFLRDVLVRLLQAALVILFVQQVLSFHQFVHASAWMYLVILLALLAFLVTKGKFRPAFDFASFPKGYAREITVFSLLSFIGTSSMILIGKMDSVMVTGMIGLEANAIYTTAFYMATVIEIPKRAITTTASPLIARAFSINDVAEISSLYRKTSINQLIIGGLLFVGVYANLDNIFGLMPKGEYYAAGSIVIIVIGLGKLTDMIFGPSSEIIGLSKHYWFNLVVITALAVMIIVANYFLIPLYGLTGAAIGSFLSLLIYNVAKFIFIFFRFGIQPFTAATVKVLAICLAALALDYLLPPLSNIFADLIVRSSLITIMYGSLVLLTRASEEVNKLFNMALAFVSGTGFHKK